MLTLFHDHASPAAAVAVARARRLDVAVLRAGHTLVAGQRDERTWQELASWQN